MAKKLLVCVLEAYANVESQTSSCMDNLFENNFGSVLDSDNLLQPGIVGL